ncbi:MAG TPA: carboxypeptidase regulatory-like domain-containing protein [Bryobacteraceae bacterium]|nr:carboxypeptidase regulatory-like domain-containing protein [Bryobacteraceae bacterium]
MHRRRIWQVGVLCAGVALATAAFAQNRTTAELVGTVTDPSGAVLPRVHVTVTNLDTQTTLQVDTNQAGYYDIPFLPPGAYAMSFELAGFQTLERKNIQLQLAQTARIDATLQIGATSSAITVEAATPLVDSADSQRGTNLSNTMVGNLPLVGRDPSSLAVLAPGTSTAQSGVAANPDPGRRNINGNRAFTISATVNGGSVILPQSQNFGPSILLPPLADVAEFEVIQDNYSAEYENGTSVLNMITKSGTNKFHGSAFEFLENDKLDARNFFAQSNPPLRYNQFGGTFGGPIKRDKLFFFFSYQNTLNPNSSIVLLTTPTDAVRAGNFTGFATIKDPLTGIAFPGNQIPASRFDLVGKAIQSYFPEPNLPGVANNFYRANPNSPTTPYEDGKVDYNLSPANQLTGSFHVLFFNDPWQSSWGGDVCNGSERCALQVTHNQQWQLSDRWTLGPTTINEFRANFIRQYYNTVSPSANQDFPQKLGLNNVPPYYFPTISISGAIAANLAPGKIGGGTQNAFSYGDNFTWIKGRHTIKMGGELTKEEYNTLATWSSGSFTFSGLFSGIGYADLLLGVPNSYSLTANPVTFGARETVLGAFIQDDFHVLPNLTLNLGVRYTFVGGFSEAHNRLANFDPSLINPATNTPGAIRFATSGNPTLQADHPAVFAPRIGLAWSVAKSWVVRAGYGVFLVPLSVQRDFNASPPGYSIQQSLQTTDLHTPIFQLSQGPPPYQYPTFTNLTPTILNGQAISYWPYHANQSYVQQWQIGIQHQLGASTMAEASYVANKGTNLLFPRDLNQVPPILLGPGNAQLSRPFTQYQGITTYFDDANSNYQALQIQLNRRLAHGVTLLANYTFSKSLDNSSYDLTTGSGGEYQISTRPDLNHALSQFDQTHRLVLASVYQLPFGLGRQMLNRGGLLNAVLGGWQTSGSFTANTGSPFTVLQGGANTSNSLAGSLFPNRLSNGALLSGQQSISQWFNTAAFASPALYTFGNSGRDILRGPGFWDFDFALMKDFQAPLHLGEEPRLEFRGDFFNLLNHPNFALPNATTGSAAFGTITSASPARTIQVGLQFMF